MGTDVLRRPGAGAGARPWIAAAWVPLALALATLALYVGVHGHAFLRVDDGEYVRDNPAVAAGLTWEGVRWAFTRAHSSNWHPLTWLAHMLDVELFGMRPGAHHLVSAGLHALNAALALLVLRRLTGRPGLALLVAAAFAWHPQRVESVAWIAERKDLLAGAAWFGTLLAYLRHRERPGPARMGMVLAVYAAGLLAKPTLVALPAVLAALEATLWARDPRRPLARRLLALAPLAALAAALALVTLRVQAASGAMDGAAEVGLGARLAQSVSSVGAYALHTLAPHRLAFFHPHDALVAPAASPLDGGFLWGLCVLVSGGLVAWRARRTQPLVTAGWLWFLLALLPTIGWVQVGEQARADRYTYLPSVGLLLALALALHAALACGCGIRARLGRLPLVLAWGWLVALAALTVREVGFWRDSETLFRRALATTERNYVAAAGLGNVLRDAGDDDRARARYEEALRARPSYPPALYGLGLLAQEAGRLPEAEARYGAALAVRPDLGPARLNLAAVLAAVGRLEEAVEELRTLLERADTDPASRRTARGNLAGLVEQLDAHLRAQPDDERARALRERAAAALAGAASP